MYNPIPVCHLTLFKYSLISGSGHSSQSSDPDPGDATLPVYRVTGVSEEQGARLFPAPSLADTLLTPPFSNPQHHLCVAVIPTVPPTKPRCLHPYHTHPTLPLPPCQPRAKRLRPVSVFRAFLHSATLVVYHLPPLTRQFKMIVLICFEPCTHCCLLASSTLPCPTLPYLN